MKDENILEQLHRTAETAGFHIISDDHCCQLLAWLYVYGGGNEQVVLDKVLNTNIMEAQRRLNIYGGDIPDLKLLGELQKYILSITDLNQPPGWVSELEERYRIKSYRRM
jgi:hypothetical protein